MGYAALTHLTPAFCLTVNFNNYYPNGMDPLNDGPADPQPDWARLLPLKVFAEIVLVLRAGLPPPVLDEPEAWAQRDRVAMDGVGSLRPENAVEARLAAEFVVADACAMDWLRQARVHRGEMKVSQRFTGQAMRMMRESKSVLNLLLRLQAARRKVFAARPVGGAGLSVEARGVWDAGSAVGSRLIH